MASFCDEDNEYKGLFLYQANTCRLAGEGLR
jgi:hypothetical protein